MSIAIVEQIKKPQPSTGASFTSAVTNRNPLYSRSPATYVKPTAKSVSLFPAVDKSTAGYVTNPVVKPTTKVCPCCGSVVSV